MSRHKNYVPKGVIPAVLLPFENDLSIDEVSFRKHLRDVAGFIMSLSQVILPVAVEELKKTNPDANTQTIVPTQVNIREAWRNPDGHHAAA